MIFLKVSMGITSRLNEVRKANYPTNNCNLEAKFRPTIQNINTVLLSVHKKIENILQLGSKFTNLVQTSLFAD